VRAAGGEAALDILRAADVAVIVTDYRMPGMTGVELLRRSQEHAPDAVRIILTAYTDVDSLMEAINTARIYHFVPKAVGAERSRAHRPPSRERYALGRENARLRDELEVAYNALRRDLAAVRARRSASTPLIGAHGGLRAATELAAQGARQRYHRTVDR